MPAPMPVDPSRPTAERLLDLLVAKDQITEEPAAGRAAGRDGRGVGAIAGGAAPRENQTPPGDAAEPDLAPAKSVFTSRSPEVRPTIYVTTEEHAVNDQAVAALAGSADLYQRAGGLVRVVAVHDGGGSRQVRRGPGASRIVMVGEATLREEMAQAALWRKRVVRTDSSAVELPAHPPDWSVRAVHERAGWPGIRPLAGIVEAPTLRPDGSILDRSGYDFETGLLYLPAAEYPPMPASPTQEDARKAAAELLALVAEFPFVSLVHALVWLAAVLTVLARAAIRGPCPLFLFEAPAAGSGKSLLAELVGLITTGREAAVSELSDDNEEVRKTITCILLEAERLVLFDNASGAFGCKALDAALTGTTYKGASSVNRKGRPKSQSPPFSWGLATTCCCAATRTAASYPAASCPSVSDPRSAPTSGFPICGRTSASTAPPWPWPP